MTNQPSHPLETRSTDQFEDPPSVVDEELSSKAVPPPAPLSRHQRAQPPSVPQSHLDETNDADELTPEEGQPNEVKRSISRLTKPWDQFWFGPIDSSFNFFLFRSGLGVLGFLWLATLTPDVATFFGSGGLDPMPFYKPTKFGIFRWLESDIFLWVGLVMGLVAAASMVGGRYVKIAAPVLAVMIASFMGDNRLLWNAGDEVLRTFTLFFAVFCLLTPSSVLDVTINKAAKSNVSVPNGRSWLFRLVQIQMTIIYLVTFLAKIPGETWRNGTASMTMFRLETMSRFYVPEFFESNFLLANIVTWSTLILEGTLPFLLWNRRARPYAVAAGVMFHLAIAWSISIGLFSWFMILGYVPFLSPNFRQNASRAGKRLRGRQP